MAKVYDEWIDKITKLREEMREYEEVAARMRREKEIEEDEILNELQYIRTPDQHRVADPDRPRADAPSSSSSCPRR